MPDEEAKSAREPGVGTQTPAWTAQARIRRQEEPDNPGIMVTWDLIDAHIILRAGCKRGIFHSYQEAMTALIMWAGNTLRDGIQAEIERQLAPPKEKLDTDQKKA